MPLRFCEGPICQEYALCLLLPLAEGRDAQCRPTEYHREKPPRTNALILLDNTFISSNVVYEGTRVVVGEGNNAAYTAASDAAEGWCGDETTGVVGMLPWLPKVVLPVTMRRCIPKRGRLTTTCQAAAATRIYSFLCVYDVKLCNAHLFRGVAF